MVLKDTLTSKSCTPKLTHIDQIANLIRNRPRNLIIREPQILNLRPPANLGGYFPPKVIQTRPKVYNLRQPLRAGIFRLEEIAVHIVRFDVERLQWRD